jgi:hypothetical protein
MAIKCISERWNPFLEEEIHRFIIDGDSDVASLPKCSTGSTAISANGGKTYMVNASGKWVESGSSVIEQIDKYMEEALGGDY